MRLNSFLSSSDISVIDEIPNNNMLTEAGLSRVLQKIKENDFAIITAYRDEYSKKENIQRNRELRSIFNDKRMGVYQLVGHWQECSLDNVDYEDCPKDKLVDVIGRSYLVARPQSMDIEEFKSLIQSLTKKYNQDASVISIDDTIYIIEPTGKLTKIGDNVTLNKINQAYSQFVKKMNVPFVFEAEVPSSNSGRRLFKENGILYPKVNGEEIRHYK